MIRKRTGELSPAVQAFCLLMAVITLIGLARAQAGISAAAEADIVPPPSFSDPVSEEARRIGDRFGLTVLTGAEAAISLPPYAASECRGRGDTLRALREAEELFARFPEGFFRALAPEGGLTLALCGRISGGRGSLGRVSALTGNFAGGAVILIDAESGSAAVSLMHELVHAADMRLDALAEDGSPYWGDEPWKKLDPPGFSSYNAYTLPDGRSYAEAGSADYTAEGGCPPEEVWFVNRYSKTFPTEDRAVLFETLMRAGGDAELFRSPHLRAKLRFMFAAARRYLDPEGAWKEPTFWELELEKAENGT